MTSMNIMGTYSGITMDTVDQLIAAERARGSKFTSQKTKIETEQNAWKDINSRLDSLFKKLDTFSKTETFNSHTVKSSMNDSASLKVSAGSKAAVGDYRVQVKQLAESTRLTGAKVETDSIYTELNVSGTFSLSVYPTPRDAEGNISYPEDFQIPEPVVDEKTGEVTQTNQIAIQIETTDSLKDISDKINEKTKLTGVSASIVDNRLVLTDTKLGDSTIQVQTAFNTVDEEGNMTESDNSLNNQLAQTLGFSSDPSRESSLRHGQNAKFTINGIDIERQSNTIDDVVEGLTFTLTNKHKDGESEVITVAEDRAKTTTAVKEFVEQYNSIMNFISTQMDVGDPSNEDNKTGALAGDGTVMRLQSGLRSIMSRNIKGDFSGDFKNLEDIGIEIDRYGVAKLDEVALNKALEADPTNVARFFYSPDTTAESKNPDTNEVIPEHEQEGISELLRNFIDTYISTSTTTPGVIKNKNETYDRMLKDINEQIETFNARIDRKRDRYIQQFTALDIAMMQAESQMDYLYSQIGLASTNQK